MITSTFLPKEKPIPVAAASRHLFGALRLIGISQNVPIFPYIM
jgi:hypothetical protein